MNIYHYSRDTGEYLGSTIAKLDPVTKEPKIPAYATVLASPVTGAEEVAVHVSGTWEIRMDKRGTRYWLSNSDPIEIKEIGVDVPAGATIVPPPDASYVLDSGNWRPKNAQEIAQEDDDQATSIVQDFQNSPALKVLVNALMNGDFVPGTQYTPAQLKAIAKKNK